MGAASSRIQAMQRDWIVGDTVSLHRDDALPFLPARLEFEYVDVSASGDWRRFKVKQVIMNDDPGREFSTWDKSKAIETVHENGPPLQGEYPLPVLTTNAYARKNTPVFSGCLAYFPLALAAVAALSQIGNEQHNPGTPLHWDRSKSGDEWDALARHLLEVGSYDTDGVRHATKVAWRALAGLQKELEQADDSSHRSTLHSPHYGGAAEDPGPGC